MKKKFLTFLIAICCVMSYAFIMTACKSDNEENANDQHTLVAVSAVSATCTEDGVTLEHQLNDYKCTSCDFQYHYKSGNEFFTYQLSDDGNSYLISEKTNLPSSNKILVPSTYNNKPVIDIGNGNPLISGDSSNKFQILLSDSIKFIAENGF